MRLVQNNEISQVSGGLFITALMLPTLCSFTAGVQGVGVGSTLATVTTLHAIGGAVMGAVLGHLVDGGNPIVSGASGAVSGSIAGVLEFALGYGFGSLYRKEDAAAA